MNSGLDMEAHSRDRGLSAAALQLARWEMPAEALKAARAIISNHERAEALVSLLPFLAPSEVPRVVDDALQVITEIARSKEVLIYRDSDDVMERWMGPTALAWLIPHASVQQEPQIAALIQLLTETWVPGAFSGYDIVFGDGVTTTRNLLELDQERLGWVRQRLLEAQARLAVRKADAERERALQDVLAQVLNLGQDPVRTLAIYNIAEFLPPTLLSMAVDIILEFDSDYWAAEALGAFVSLVDDESILNLVELATRFPAAEARDTLLAVAASQLCERRAPEPALDVAQKIESASSRYRVFSELAPLLEELPPEELIRLWQAPRPAQTLLASAASGNRQALLVQLQGLASVIHRAGGQATCEALYQALDDVSLWWP